MRAVGLRKKSGIKNTLALKKPVDVVDDKDKQQDLSNMYKDKENVENTKQQDLHVSLLSPLHSRFPFQQDLKNCLVRAGIEELHEWQAECLLKNGLGRNLVYSAPTSAGKSLVAEVLMLDAIISKGVKAILVLPYISIVMEKSASLSRLIEGLPIRIGAFYGSQPSPNFNDIQLAICTIEKANGLVNSLIQDGRIEQVGIIAIDEIHLIGQEQRGYLLELLLTKVLMIDVDIQLIGMSATISNLPLLCSWLNATSYTTHFRPVQLKEYIKVGNSVDIMDSTQKVVRRLPVDIKEAARLGDSDLLIPLIFETVSQGCSVIVFCPTKNHCQTVCSLVTRLMVLDTPYELQESRSKLLEELPSFPSASILKGIAFHHSGLTTEERESIEKAFRGGILSVLIATSTLAAGVNLPARRIIFRTPSIGKNLFTPSEYQQMKGRAGRKGLDEMGESILMCQPKDFLKCLSLMSSESNAIESCLTTNHLGRHRALLEGISLGLISTEQDLLQYIDNMLLSKHAAYSVDLLHDSIRYLIEKRFVSLEEGQYHPNLLGQATLASSLNPEEALMVAAELHRDLYSFCIADSFHTIYHCTPISYHFPMPWSIILDIYSSCSGSRRVVAGLVGIDQAYLQKLSLGSSADQSSEKFRIHRRWGTALILQDILNDVPLQSLSNSNEIPRGQLQNLLNLSATFNGQIINFCKAAGMSSILSLLQLLQDKFITPTSETERSELLAFSPELGNALFANGIKTIREIIDMEFFHLQSILASVYPTLSAQEIRIQALKLQMKAQDAAVLVQGGTSDDDGDD